MTSPIGRLTAGSLRECTPENCYEQIASEIVRQADMQLGLTITGDTNFAEAHITLAEVRSLARSVGNVIPFADPDELLDLETVDEWARAIYRRIGHEFPLPMIL